MPPESWIVLKLREEDGGSWKLQAWYGGFLHSGGVRIYGGVSMIMYFLCCHGRDQRSMDISGIRQICVVIDGWNMRISLWLIYTPVFPVSLIEVPN